MEDIERITIYNPKNIHFTLCLFLVDDLIDFIQLYAYQPAKIMLLITVYLSNQCTFVNGGVHGFIGTKHPANLSSNSTFLV